MNLDGLVVNRYSKMCFPVGVKMKENYKEHIADINSEANLSDIGFPDLPVAALINQCEARKNFLPLGTSIGT